MYQKTVLKNGIRVLSVPKHDTEAMTLLVMCGVGSRYETARNAGASHFIEHMLFKGTRKRPNSSKITRELDAVGADYNAFTSREYTGYYIRLHADHGTMAVDMLHDILFNSTFMQEECERERGVILEEIRMYEDNPGMHVAEMLDGLIYEGCPLGRNIAGTRKTVSDLSRKDLMAFWRTQYAPSKIVVAAAGRIDDVVMRRIESSFGSVHAGRKKPKSFRRATLKTGTTKLALKTKDTEQVQFTVGFPGLSSGHKLISVQAILSIVLGGGMSSRLFTEVREKRGLAYSVHTGISTYSDAGDFSVQAGLNKEKAEAGIRTILRELSKIARYGPTTEEASRAREFIKGKIILNLENSSELAEFYAKQELLNGTIETAERKIAKLERVTRVQVRDLARRLFRNSKMSAAVIGPLEDKTKLQKLLKLHV